jgi:DNA replication protein DnaC
MEAEQFNETEGILGKDGYNVLGLRVRGDGYDCPMCRNRGMIWRVSEDAEEPYLVAEMCECYRVRASIRRMRESGLADAMERFTFERFEAREPWQQAMLETARRYVAEGAEAGKWLYFGGQPGCGKTMLATAATCALLKNGMEARYVVWPQAAKHIKALAMDAEAYEREVMPLQRVRLLYIDDFFKPIGARNAGSVTDADVKLAFEILNQRMVDGLPTILSSEWHLREMADIDEALASRVYEASAGYRVDVMRDRSRNFRWKDAEPV